MADRLGLGELYKPPSPRAGLMLSGVEVPVKAAAELEKSGVKIRKALRVSSKMKESEMWSPVRQNPGGLGTPNMCQPAHLGRVSGSLAFSLIKCSIPMHHTQVQSRVHVYPATT